MGSIFRPTYAPPGQTYAEARQAGTLRESAVWWVRFRQHGKTLRQSAETTSEAKARTFLREREGKVALNIPVVPKAERLTLAEAATLVQHDYTANARKSTANLTSRLRRLLAAFGPSTRLARLTTGAVEAYKAARLATPKPPAPATVNREIAILGRMATLARHQYGLIAPFRVAKLEERNVRTGFFEEPAFAAVCRALPPELAALATVAKVTGWRKGELCSRQWRHVDFGAGWLRLEPQETKNGDGRQFPLIPALRAVLEAQRVRGEAIQRETGRVIPWVFCRDTGAPVRNFKKAWATACIRAGFFRIVPVLDDAGQPRRAKDGTPLTVRKATKLVHEEAGERLTAQAALGPPRPPAGAGEARVRALSDRGKVGGQK